MNIQADLMANTVFGNILSVVIAILILLLTITVHEFGHYIVGKIFKFKINEFAIGMGPAIFKKTLKNGEIFSVRIFPLGGYCAFEGEDGGEDQAEKRGKAEEKTDESDAFDEYPEKKSEAVTLSENAFGNKKPWQRILVLLAGATMNFIFAIILITVKFVGYGHFAIAPAEIVGGGITVGESLLAGDAIVKINGEFIYLSTDIIGKLNGKNKGDLIEVEVARDGARKKFSVALLCDVRCDGLTDVAPCYEALGVGAVVAVGTTDESPIKNGSYLYRFAEYTDEARYRECTRIMNLDELYERLKDLSAGEKLAIWTYYEGDGARTLVYLTAPDDYGGVDKSSKADVLGAFGIDSEPVSVSYQVASSSVRLGFFEALMRSPAYGFRTLWVTLRSFGELIGGKIAITEMSGPIGTVTITSRLVSSWRLDYILEIAALIGISIAVFNVLPIPALDGARVVFVIVEWIRKKPVDPKIEGTIHLVGLIALIAFAVLVDLLKIF